MRLSSDPERKIVFIVADGATALDAAGPLEVFATASGICEQRGFPAPYSMVLASAHGGIVRTRTGLEILTRPLDDFVGQEIDTVIVAGRGTNGAEEDRTVAWLKRHAGFVRRLCSVCVGAFVLARSGLLDDRASTTHWGALDNLAAEFPATKVESGRIFVRDGSVWTSAGVLAGVDLALQLVEDDLGEELAMRIAKVLVTFVRRSADHPQQSAMLQMQATVDSDFSDLVRWMGDNLALDLHVEDLASRAGMTPRTFARRFKAVTGTTPSNAVSRLRIEAAKQVMAQKRRSMKEVAAMVGFKTEINLRRALRKFDRK